MSLFVSMELFHNNAFFLLFFWLSYRSVQDIITEYMLNRNMYIGYLIFISIYIQKYFVWNCLKYYHNHLCNFDSPKWLGSWIDTILYTSPGKFAGNYRKTSNIRLTLVGNKIVDHSDVVGASPVGAAPTTSSFST